MHQRYVDDTNIAAKSTETGARYDGEKLVIHEDTVMEDEDVPPEKKNNANHTSSMIFLVL